MVNRSVLYIFYINVKGEVHAFCIFISQYMDFSASATNEEKLMQIWCVADAIYIFCHVCAAHNENDGKCSHSLFGNRKYHTKCIQTTLYSHYL